MKNRKARYLAKNMELTLIKIRNKDPKIKFFLLLNIY